VLPAPVDRSQTKRIEMNPFPLVIATLEQIVAYIRYALEKHSACVFILALLFVVFGLPLAAGIDLALLPARLENTIARAARS
jgi:hypothetical protein